MTIGAMIPMGDSAASTKFPACLFSDLQLFNNIWLTPDTTGEQGWGLSRDSSG
jgi:hypothetical protein